MPPPVPIATAPWGVYVHVPWCKRRCPYCAFYVEVDRATPWEAYVDRVRREHAIRSPDFGDRASTVFLGGGTPSRLPTAALARLLAGLPRLPDAEVSAETNPEDATAGWLEGALASGVNRLSLGVQTLDPRFAALLNRAATVREAAETLDRVRRAGFRSWSVDLIFGLPDQTLDDLRADLDRLLSYEPPHVSLYGLTIEPGTPFERAHAKGTLEPADEDLWREMYDLVVATLRTAGIHRYEVSNFAKAGHRSEHNRLYWSDRPYLGLGPSAHGYAPDGRRWNNVPDVGRYLLLEDPTEISELPEGDARATDLLVSALRSVEGVDRAHLERTTRRRIAPATVESLVAAGVLREEGERIALTDEGFPLADGISARLADALVPVD